MENLLFTFTKKNPPEFLVEQRAKSNEEKVTSNEQRGKSNEQRAKSFEQKVTSNEQRAKKFHLIKRHSKNQYNVKLQYKPTNQNTNNKINRKKNYVVQSSV